MPKPIEPSVGDEFSFLGDNYKCIAGGDCDYCDIEGDGCLVFACRFSERADFTNVRFVKIQKLEVN